MKTVAVPHLVAVALAAGATGAFLSTIVLKNGGAEAGPMSLGNDGASTSADVSRFDALDEQLARIDLRLTALELVAEPSERVPASGYVTRDELEELLAEALASGRVGAIDEDDTKATDDPNLANLERLMTDIKSGKAPSPADRTKPAPDRAEVLETLTNKYETWLGLDAVQRESMLGALYDQEARREEIARLAAEGADLEYLGQLKGENTQAFQAALTSILTPEQLETMNGSGSTKKW
jgi:hypothetical protein